MTTSLAEAMSKTKQRNAVTKMNMVRCILTS
jgi:hypothetical protein